MSNANQAIDYDVAIIPAIVAPGATYWRAVEVRHLSPSENRGRHNVYVDVVDPQGRRVFDPALRIGWTWHGRRQDEAAPPRPLDKPLSEPAGSLDMYINQTLTVWLADPNRATDAVDGLHTRHPDERGPLGQLWNTIGHHSFYIRFQLTTAAGELPPPDATLSLAERVAALEAWREDVDRYFRQITGEL